MGAALPGTTCITPEMELSEYMALDATALAELVATKDVTAKELLALARKRSGQVNGRINAIVARIDWPAGPAPTLAAKDAAGLPLAKADTFA